MNQTEQTQAYAIDPAHSSVEFVVRHMMISKVRGRFTGVTGTIEVPQGADVPTAVKVSLDAATIDTHEPQRDGHLKSADFFEVERYPTLQFSSTSIEGKPDRFKIHGTLEMHGKNQPITLDASYEGRLNDPFGKQRVAYSAQGKLRRSDFGLTWNQAIEAGGVMVSDDIRIEIEIEATLQ
jgi:polyisoprenoid-binding protein YceI